MSVAARLTIAGISSYVTFSNEKQTLLLDFFSLVRPDDPSPPGGPRGNKCGSPAQARGIGRRAVATQADHAPAGYLPALGSAEAGSR